MANDRDNHEDGVSRRYALERMMWISAAVLWTVSDGVPTPLSLLGRAEGLRIRTRCHSAKKSAPGHIADLVVVAANDC